MIIITIPVEGFTDHTCIIDIFLPTHSTMTDGIHFMIPILTILVCLLDMAMATTLHIIITHTIIPFITDITTHFIAHIGTIITVITTQILLFQIQVEKDFIMAREK